MVLVKGISARLRRRGRWGELAFFGFWFFGFLVFAAQAVWFACRCAGIRDLLA